MKAIVTVLGKDKVGIIADIAILMKSCGVNICDISQTLMQDYFTMIMLVDLSSSTVEFTELQRELKKQGEKIGVDIRIQHQDLFDSMHKI
ncbi:MAG TPA: ACT domain-containing protein [Firmicutes bacterium]|nr:ACT domain-containing protein [Bacillota bacterium]